MDSRKRSALLLRCTTEEADMIREAANREHRTISGYIMNVVMSRIRNRDTAVQRMIQQTFKRGRKEEPS